MTIGDIVFVNGAGREQRLRPLTVRQVCTMQRVLASRKAAACAEDCRAVGIDPADALKAVAAVRDQCALTSTLIRWCFETDGAYAIIAEACQPRTDAEVNAAVEGMTPDELTEVALQLVGFEWDASAGKWKSRAAMTSDRAIGS